MTTLRTRLAEWLRPIAGRMAAAAALQAGTLAAAVALMGTSAWLIAAAALHPSIAVLQLAIVGVRFFGIARGILRYAERLASHDVTLRAIEQLRTRIYTALEPLAPGGLAMHRSGDLMARFVSDVDALEHAFVRLIGPSASAVLAALFTAALLMAWHLALPAIALVGLAAAGVAFPWLAWRLGGPAGAAFVTTRARLQAVAVDGIQGLADLIAFGRTAAHAEEVHRLSGALARAQVRGAAYAAVGTALAGLAADLTALSVLAAAIHLASSGQLAPVSLAAVTLVTLAAFEAVAALPAAYQSLGTIGAATERIQRVLTSPPVVSDPPRPGTAPVGRTLELRDLSFAYPGAAAPVLRGITLQIAPGRPIAIVGPSGSGKSTIVHLAARFYDVPPGTVLLDGVDVTTLRADEVRGRLGIAPQEAYLFAGTVRANLLIARPSASEDDLAAALRRAQMDAVVAALPLGLETWIGEHGLQLSGGERQRLALARLFLKDAPIVIADEPTAHLDAARERAVIHELTALSATRGLAIVTHRLQALESMHEILVLEQGGVAERGRFDELVAADGLFTRLLRVERDAI